METPRTQITIARTLPSDLGTRDVILLLDNQPLATLHYGESITRDITPGHHKLYAHNTLMNKTVEFNAPSGEHIRFVTSNYGGLVDVDRDVIWRRAGLSLAAARELV